MIVKFEKRDKFCYMPFIHLHADVPLSTDSFIHCAAGDAIGLNEK